MPPPNAHPGPHHNHLATCVVTAREKRKKVKSGKTGCVHTPESADELDFVGLVAEVPATVTGTNRQQGVDQQSNTDQQQQAVEQQATGSSKLPTKPQSM